MGIFDIFKKKTEQQPAPKNLNEENILESILRKASAEPAYRADFYKKLLSEQLVVLTANTGISEGERVLEENTNVDIATLQDGRIPVFSSTSRIFDKGVIKEQVPFLEMKGEDLFNLATGATFILNPFSDYSKELLPHEIESLLKGTILTDSHKKMTVQQDTQVQIGQPANYPTAIVNSLKKLFAERPSVKAAYLGWIYNPSSATPPHLIIALDIDGDRESIFNEAGFTAQQQLEKPGDVLDFMQIDHSGGLSEYFLNQTTPFYVR